MSRWRLWRRARPSSADEPGLTVVSMPRTVYVQFDMRVLNLGLPTEIEGTCNQRPFYYRARGERWSISPHVVDHAHDRVPLASGVCDIDEQTDLGFAVARIFERVIQPALDR